MSPSTRVCEGFLRAFALALVVIITILLPVNRASANGLHVASTEVFAGPLGPYDVKVRTAPVAGYIHLTIFVSPLGRTVPVWDAKVQISGRGPQGASQTVGPMGATPSQIGPNWYAVSLPIEGDGEWMLILTVESSLGDATVDIPVRVGQSGGVSWSVVGIGVFLLLLVLWFGVKTLRQRSSTNPAPRQRKRSDR